MMQFESWIDRQIREAMERGEFDNLPGAGRPLELDTSEDWWIKAKIRRENLDAVLPGPLALRREVEGITDAVADCRTEAEVRERCEALNERIRDHYLRPETGRRIIVGKVDVDAVVEGWRARGNSGR
ncbi:MAG TPA: DUF1992 domain-containing protein [Propionibacterium sp.]|nr:DUF1992 domain-containing protein [Propionibacterium sp.]